MFRTIASRGCVVAASVFMMGFGVDARASDPHVSNVRALQLDDGTKRVEVLYDLAGAPTNGATVSVAFSATGAAPYDITPQTSVLSGDIGTSIPNGGNRRILWDTAATLPANTYGTNYRAAVTGIDPGGSGNDITITLPGGVEMELVHIPAGTFQMGSPSGERGRLSPGDEDLHQVTLTRGYYLGKYEVTQGQWEAVMGTPMSSECGSLGVGNNHPVFCVSWDDICGGSTGADCVAGSFVGRLNTYLGSSKFRLPTEAEWERAARAGTQTEFSFDVSGNPNWDLHCGSFPEAESHMWWCGNTYPGGARQVGEFLPNGFGLFDMHGNLWEWVADWYTVSLGNETVSDPVGPPSGWNHVVRGGFWNHAAWSCRSASRNNGSTYEGVGFRLARSE
jgi:formylglycine-generating enzyme required for sulfatase activity